MDVIYVTDDPWITDRSEELRGEWLHDHPGAVVLDSLWVYINGCTTIVVPDSKEVRNEAIFEWDEF